MPFRTAFEKTLQSNFPTVYNRWLQFPKKNSVLRIVARNGSPAFEDSDQTFDALQAAYPKSKGYDYDPFSTWQRGTKRVSVLMKKFPELRNPGLQILEAGCGDGMVSFLLKCYGHELRLLDAEDWRDARARKLNFTACSLTETIPIESMRYDLVFSFNTFEHLADPSFTLTELMRIVKPHGHVFLSFGPLYYSPWGLHAYRSLFMPYPQILFSQEFIQKKLSVLGIRDLGREREELQPLNRWSVGQYEQLWKQYQMQILSCEKWYVVDHLKLVENFPNAFAAKNLTYEDLITEGYQVILKKKGLN